MQSPNQSSRQVRICLRVAGFPTCCSSQLLLLWCEAMAAGLAPEQGSQGRCPKVFDGCCVFLLQMSSQSNFKVLVIQNAFLQLVQSCRLRCCLWFILSFLYSQCHQCFPLDCRMRSSQGNFKRQIHVSLCIQNSRSATWRKRSVNMSQCHHLQL